MYWNGHGMSGWGWFAMSLGSVLLILLVVAVVLLVVHTAGRGPVGRQDEPAAPSAEQLLAERFALGEVDDEEYERRLATLRRHRPGRTGR
ncbi:SHOCT domain-containing protein [Streptomyces sp. NPDC059104]|uniref:SHOCT domain-containing protein n=1 Tax=Streptomyces sp. NPDC059104 TaxID=3346729 RepID=UPI0036A77992